MEVMGQGFDAEYSPNKELVGIYEKRYEHYKKFGNLIEQQTKESFYVAANLPTKETASA
jgi:L-ribulokinase